ncbi:MAG: hypothetical protein OEZ58_21865, partial [Gammaproteobacteria bacterium]|nr:hypothetical protein [Gammaproteobacteria bacterium]
LLGTRRAQGLWFAGVFSILLASFFWWASRTGNFLCDPQSWFQPHGLLWHTLAGMTALCLYFYFRLEGSQAN